MVNQRIDFFEGEIAFEFDKNDNLLIVILNFSFHPKGERFEYGKDSEYKLSFPLTSPSIYQLIDSLSKTYCSLKKRR